MVKAVAEWRSCRRSGFTIPYQGGTIIHRIGTVSTGPLPFLTILHSGTGPAMAHLYHGLPPGDNNGYYRGLELVAGDAVDEGDAVLFFIG